MSFTVFLRSVFTFLLFTIFASAQTMQHDGMSHDGMSMPDAPEPNPFINSILEHSTSGTSAEPDSTSAPMLMTMKGKWMLMFHGTAWINMIQQSGPRGADKVFST